MVKKEILYWHTGNAILYMIKVGRKAPEWFSDNIISKLEFLGEPPWHAGEKENIKKKLSEYGFNDISDYDKQDLLYAISYDKYAEDPRGKISFVTENKRTAMAAKLFFDEDKIIYVGA